VAFESVEAFRNVLDPNRTQVSDPEDPAFEAVLAGREDHALFGFKAGEGLGTPIKL
jgi:hypothetical protein